MKKILAVFFVLNALPLQAAFEETTAGARAAGLGGAYATLGDDVTSLFANPAGLARMAQAEAAAEYARLYTGLSDGSNIGHGMLSAGVPTSWGTFAVGWQQLSLSDLYEERTLTAGYSRWIGTRLAVGGSFKQLYHAFTEPGTTVDDNGNIHNRTPSLFTEKGNSVAAYAADAGVLYRLGRYQWLGASVKNINAPNIALDKSDTDRAPRSWRAGWAYQNIRRLSAAAEAQMDECGDCGETDKQVTGAMEKGWAWNTAVVSVRGAYTHGTRELRQVSSGFGVAMGRIRLDYAFLFGLSGVELGDTSGTHRISLAYGVDVKKKLLPPVKTAAVPQKPTAAPAEPPPPVEENIMNVPKGFLEEDMGLYSDVVDPASAFKDETP